MESIEDRPCQNWKESKPAEGLPIGKGRGEE
jgi:hypothetical protein